MKAVDLEASSQGSRMEPGTDYRALFHRLNNQLGVVLANAELLESRCADQTLRARASQVVAGAIDAISTAQQLRAVVETLGGGR